MSRAAFLADTPISAPKASDATADSGPPSVELRDVVKRFGDVVAVDHVSLEVRRGEFLTLLGPSGCGKTTTLRMIGGFELPSSGQILIHGVDMSRQPPYRRPVNTVFQNYALFPHLTVGQNISYGLIMAKVPRAERERRVAEALEMVRLPHVEHRRPSELSGGQQQRVALARALVNRPQVLLLDEPLGALDLKLRKAMQLELKRLNREVGATFLYVTHDQEEALTMSDRIAVMSEGRILQIGTPAEIYERPNSRFVADFIGQTNFLEGTCLHQVGDECEIDVPGVGVVRGRSGKPLAARSSVWLAVRPEKLSLMMDQHAAGVPSGWNVLRGRVEDVVYLGTHNQIVVRLTDLAALTVLRQNHSTIEPALARGEPVVIAFDPAVATVLDA
ncbi:MAG: spermidine/putrescine import ATP-binding protein PotA [Thermomicrobiales bacterium]|nr:MAG: spermidine/putrescine import ATP-binding protein PotA [Thermomicrobiales bacterium]